MAIITTEVLTACGIRPEARENHAKAALEGKYNKEFEITEIYPQKFGDLYYSVQAYAVDDPELRFTADIDTEDEGVSDTYVERLICAELTRQAEKNLDGLPGYYYVFTHAIGPQPITDNAEISVEDYMALHPKNKFRFCLFFVPDNADASDVYGCLEKMLAGLDYISGDIQLFLINEEKMAAVQEYFAYNDDFKYGYSQLIEDFYTIEYTYEKGTIALTENNFISAMENRL